MQQEDYIHVQDLQKSWGAMVNVWRQFRSHFVGVSSWYADQEKTVRAQAVRSKPPDSWPCHCVADGLRRLRQHAPEVASQAVPSLADRGDRRSGRRRRDAPLGGRRPCGPGQGSNWRTRSTPASGPTIPLRRASETSSIRAEVVYRRAAQGPGRHSAFRPLSPPSRAPAWLKSSSTCSTMPPNTPSRAVAFRSPEN